MKKDLLKCLKVSLEIRKDLMVKKICRRPSCSCIALLNGYCEDHQGEIKEVKKEWKKDFKCRSYKHLYDSARWKRRREKQLKKQPLCEECLKQGIITIAAIADHIEDHKGDLAKFFQGKLQSLCPSCHSKKTNRDNFSRRK